MPPPALREGAGPTPLPEVRLRLGRVLTILDRLDEADRQLGPAMALRPDARQAYLTALFLADLRERAGTREEAMAAYAGAPRRGPAPRRRWWRWRACAP